MEIEYDLLCVVAGQMYYATTSKIKKKHIHKLYTYATLRLKLKCLNEYKIGGQKCVFGFLYVGIRNLCHYFDNIHLDSVNCNVSVGFW